MIIAFTGNLRTGKTTAAEYFENSIHYDCVKFSFGEGVKDIAYNFGWKGKKDKKGRWLLQMIGTEIGRNYDPDIWIKKVALKMLDNKADHVVIDDLRFENEAEWVLSQGGIIIEIQRKGYTLGWFKKLFAHKSEKGIPENYIGMSILNNGKHYWDFHNDLRYMAEQFMTISE